MTFRPDAQLDPGRVTDARGRRVRGGGIAVGGGLGGLVLVALYLLMGGNLGDLAGGAGAPAEGPVGSQLAAECDTGEEANQRLAQSNAQQVRLVRAIIEGLGRQIATPDEARAILSLKGGDKVNF